MTGQSRNDKGGAFDRWKGWVPSLVAAALYFGLSPSLFLPTGGTFGAFMMVPLALAALAGGLRGALLACALLFPLNVAMVVALDPPSQNLLEGAVFSHSAALLMAATIGWARDRLRSQVDRAQAAESALLIAKERFELAAKAARDGLWAWMVESDEVLLSARWMALVGERDSAVRGPRTLWLERVHPEDRERLENAIADHLAGRSPRLEIEHRLRMADGTWLWTLARGIASRDEAGRAIQFAGWLTDIHRTRTDKELLRKAAFHDVLTGLANRALFLERLGHAVERGRRRGAPPFALILLDLDSFKEVNDVFGHPVGDLLLREVANRLESCVRPGDTVARLGGDEFVVLLEGVSTREDLVAAGERIERVLGQPMQLQEIELRVRASLGAVWDPAAGESPDDLLRDVDIAMYRAKESRGPMVFFNDRMREAVLGQVVVSRMLHSAIEQDQLRVLYQPIVNLTTGRPIGVEALVRWKHPTEGFLGAMRFVPTAERTGLINELGLWVLRRSLAQAGSWEGIDLSVNVSPLQLRDRGFSGHVLAACDEVGFDPGRLIFELTETAMMGDRAGADAALGGLRERGVRLALDDFGTGWSSLAALQRFPVDALKIDGSFVRRLPLDSTPAGFVGTIVALAAHLHRRVVAEGVETTEQLALLRGLGVKYAQGYLFSRPVPPEEIPALLARDSLLPVRV